MIDAIRAACLRLSADLAEVRNEYTKLRDCHQVTCVQLQLPMASGPEAIAQAIKTLKLDLDVANQRIDCLNEGENDD